MNLQSTTLVRLILVVTLAATSAACDAIGFIFKAGMYTGVIAVVLVVVVLAFVVAKLRR